MLGPVDWGISKSQHSWLSLGAPGKSMLGPVDREKSKSRHSWLSPGLEGFCILLLGSCVVY